MVELLSFFRQEDNSNIPGLGALINVSVILAVLEVLINAGLIYVNYTNEVLQIKIAPILDGIIINLPLIVIAIVIFICLSLGEYHLAISLRCIEYLFFVYTLYNVLLACEIIQVPRYSCIINNYIVVLIMKVLAYFGLFIEALIKIEHYERTDNTFKPVYNTVTFHFLDALSDRDIEMIRATLFDMNSGKVSSGLEHYLGFTEKVKNFIERDTYTEFCNDKILIGYDDSRGRYWNQHWFNQYIGSIGSVFSQHGYSFHITASKEKYVREYLFMEKWGVYKPSIIRVVES